MPDSADTTSSAASSSLSGTVTVKILSPSNEIGEGLRLNNIPLSMTIGDLKKRITSTVPSHPAASRQKLIYRGRVVSTDTDTIDSIVDPEDIQNLSQHVFHLVLKESGPTPRPSYTQSSSAASTASRPPLVTARFVAHTPANNSSDSNSHTQQAMPELSSISALPTPPNLFSLNRQFVATVLQGQLTPTLSAQLNQTSQPPPSSQNNNFNPSSFDSHQTPTSIPQLQYLFTAHADTSPFDNAQRSRDSLNNNAEVRAENAHSNPIPSSAQSHRPSTNNPTDRPSNPILRPLFNVGSSPPVLTLPSLGNLTISVMDGPEGNSTPYPATHAFSSGAFRPSMPFSYSSNLLPPVMPQTELYYLHSPDGYSALLVGPQGLYHTGILPSHLYQNYYHRSHLTHRNSNNTSLPHFSRSYNTSRLGTASSSTLAANNANASRNVAANLAEDAQNNQRNANGIRNAFLPLASHLWLALRIFGLFYLFIGNSFSWSIFNRFTISLAFVGLFVYFFLSSYIQRTIERIRNYFQDLFINRQIHPNYSVPSGSGDNSSTRQTSSSPPTSNQPSSSASQSTLRANSHDSAHGHNTQNFRSRNWMPEVSRSVERAIALFLASLWPGLGERVIRARQEHESRANNNRISTNAVNAVEPIQQESSRVSQSSESSGNNNSIPINTENSNISNESSPFVPSSPSASSSRNAQSTGYRPVNHNQELTYRSSENSGPSVPPSL